MRVRGLERPRKMWAALHDQNVADQAFWDMALEHVRKHGCDVCGLSPSLFQSPSDIPNRASS
jgi:hypothetical protein